MSLVTYIYQFPRGMMLAMDPIITLPLRRQYGFQVVLCCNCNMSHSMVQFPLKRGFPGFLGALVGEGYQLTPEERIKTLQLSSSGITVNIKACKLLRYHLKGREGGERYIR